MTPITSSPDPASLERTSSALPQPRKLKALERNNLQWDSHKDEIRTIHIEQDKTLKETYALCRAAAWLEEKVSYTCSAA